MGSDHALSFYETAELKQTLERLVDFDLINSRHCRISVGAVNVRTGNFVYFDSDKQRTEPEHIMASSALPPALPAVKIEGEYYWDGGIVSNTPLRYLRDQESINLRLCSKSTLFSTRSALPRSMAEVLARYKDITYSSRTRQNTDAYARVHKLKLVDLTRQ